MTTKIAQKIQLTVRKHELWRQKCLNLIPSENLTSPQVRAMLGSDFGHRYAWDEFWYGGQKYSVEIEEQAVEAAKKLFRAKYANVRPLSGHLSLMAVIMGMCQPGDPIVISHFDNGGYPLNLQARFPLDVHYLPYLQDQYSMDVPGAIKLIGQVRPRLVILGASIFLKPHPVTDLAKICQETGATLVYDGSHVLGLIAGGQFQNPFKEGAQIMLGSTHKTFFGPQGGIVLVKDDEDLAEQVSVTLRPNPVLVDNYHHHRVAALAVALAELLAFGKAYAKQVVDNSQELAQSLVKLNIPVIGVDWEYTSSHQVLLETKDFEQGKQMCTQLEAADIIADAGVRLGSQEVTRRGMRTAQMPVIAQLIAERLQGADPSQVKEQVHSLTSQFQSTAFCFY
ncbi:MAG: aminotransferase class I/II-fold pyridoxal phosphate-dependent enzyme [Candidatus Hermodarchaeia archaeon]